jgi:hypothetical protein
MSEAIILKLILTSHETSQLVHYEEVPMAGLEPARDVIPADFKSAGFVVITWPREIFRLNSAYCACFRLVAE